MRRCHANRVVVFGVGDSVPDSCHVAKSALPSEDSGDDPFPKEVVSAKWRRPYVGESVPDKAIVVGGVHHRR